MPDTSVAPASRYYVPAPVDQWLQENRPVLTYPDGRWVQAGDVVDYIGPGESDPGEVVGYHPCGTRVMLAVGDERRSASPAELRLMARRGHGEVAL